MNKRLDLTKLGGYPLTQNDLNWMQVSYRGAFAAISSLIGDSVIISGMVEAGGNVTAGWISIAGELVPFSAGTIGSGDFIIDQTETELVFKDGVSKVVRIERFARFSAGGAYNYNNLTRLEALSNIWLPGDIKEKFVSNGYINTNFDVNGFGQGREKGWRILSKVYPDSAGKVFVNRDNEDPDFYSCGQHGGEKKHALTINENAPHTHNLTIPLHDTGSGSINPGGDHGGQQGSKNLVTSSSGLGTPHNNMQPYFVILKLIKL